jgi:hypothetical protein
MRAVVPSRKERRPYASRNVNCRSLPTCSSTKSASDPDSLSPASPTRRMISRAISSETSSDHRSTVLKATTRTGFRYWPESRSAIRMGYPPPHTVLDSIATPKFFGASYDVRGCHFVECTLTTGSLILMVAVRRRTALIHRSEVERSLTETTLPFLSGIVFHDCDISVGLIGNHLPASHKASQNCSLGSALCQKHKATTFLGLGPAPSGFLHFPSGIKKGQWRPARYTRPKSTKTANWLRLRQCQSRISATSAGPTGSASFSAACVSLLIRREHNTLSHRTSAGC